MANYPELLHKRIVVTGASGDIGLAICQKYLAQGAMVYAVFRQNKQALLKLQQKYSQQLVILQANLAEKQQIEQLAEQLMAHTAAVDILINNAGIYKDNLFSAMSYEDFDQVIKLNLYGTFYITRKLLPLLRQAPGAAVINVASIAGVTASFGQTNYSAAKAGIIGFTRTLAMEYASKGIRVNAIAPGMVESTMVKKVPRQIVRAIIAAIALKRLGQVDEIAEAVAFLSSTAASYIVGQTLIADGGLVMH